MLFVPGESPATLGPLEPESGKVLAESTPPVEDGEVVESDLTVPDGPIPVDDLDAIVIGDASPVDPPEHRAVSDDGSEVRTVVPEVRAHAEAVAQTLESLAERVRVGAVALPPWLDGADEAATLAGLLAGILAPAPDGAVDRRLAEGVEGGEGRS